MTDANYIETAARVRRKPDETLEAYCNRAAEAILPGLGYYKAIAPNTWVLKSLAPGFAATAKNALRYEATRMQDALRDAGFLHEEESGSFCVFLDIGSRVDVRFNFDGDALERTIAAYWFLQLIGGGR